MTSAGRYASRVKAYYETYLPSEIEQMEDPERFFLTQGKAIAHEVRSLETTFAATSLNDGDYLTRVGQLETARMQAEEKVLGEMLFSLTPEPGTEDLEPPTTLPPRVTRVE